MVGCSTANEINFDGLVGPTYNYAATAPGPPGNLASRANRGKPSNPRAAALEGLAKATVVRDLGTKQAVLPPLVRPKLEPLFRLGLIKDRGLLGADDPAALARHLARHATAAPHLLAACFSGASLWTANWGTVSPSADTEDGRVHFTPANQSRSFHRSLEAEDAGKVLKQIFFEDKFFSIHDPLPNNYAIGDEGAANHLRLAAEHAAKAVNVFVYGRAGFEEPDREHLYLARQTLEASRAVARLHELDPHFSIFVRQNPAAIDAGIFHNDVIASANLDLLFYHEQAYSESTRTICDITEAFRSLPNGGALRTIEVRKEDVSLEEAAVSYLFNSQIVNDDSGRTILIAPRQCAVVPSVRRLLEKLKKLGPEGLDEIVFVDVPSSMRSGGGPGCLRLRVVLTQEQVAATQGRVILDDALLSELTALIETEYPVQVDERMFAEEEFLTNCFDVARRVYALLGLKPAGLTTA
jgi:succinylarginine dihydrolase